MNAYAPKSKNTRRTFQAILPWVVWVLGCVFYFYESLLQVSIGVMSSELMRDFAITSQTLGFLSGIFYYLYTPMQFPCGMLMDKFGPNKILTIATVICAVNTIAFGLTYNLFMACTTRLFIGLGAAFAAVGTMKLAANWFATEKFALLTGLLVTIGMLGAIGAEGPLAIFIEFTGWRNCMIYMGLLGLALALLIFMVAKDKPSEDIKIEQNMHSKSNSSMFASLRVLLKNKELWIVACYGGLMYMSTPVFCGLWGVPFLMFKMHVTKTIAANYISLVFLGWAIASPLWGIFSNRIGLRKPPMYFGAIGALITSLLFIYAPIGEGFIMGASLFLFGVFSAGFLCAFSVAKELCSSNYTASGLGFMNMLNMVGIAIAQPLIGFILDKLWAGEYLNQVRVYPIQAYHIGLSILPIGIFIALIILPKVRETHCRNIAD